MTVMPVQKSMGRPGVANGKVEVTAISCADFNAMRSEATDPALLMSMCIGIGQRERLRAFDLRLDGHSVGRLFGVREPFRYEIHFGPLTLFRFKTERLRIIGEYGVVGLSCAELLAESLTKIALTERSVTLQAIPSDSALYHAIGVLRGCKAVYVRSAYPERARHRLVPEGDFETYLKGLSKSTRQTFRYTLRKLHENRAIELRVYERPEAVDEFVSCAATVARTTYQQNRLRLGFSDIEGVTRRLRLAAEQGWLRSFVLFCDGAPAAYIESYQGGGRWFAFQIGHNPKWNSVSLGTACQLVAIRQLLDSADRPRVIDYLEGEKDYKRRLCNVQVRETTVELATRISSAALLSRTQAALDVAFRLVRAVLLSLGWRRERRDAQKIMSQS